MGLHHFALLCVSAFAANFEQTLYFTQKGDLEKGIANYMECKEKTHDFEVLEQLAHIILEQGSTSSDPETQLLSIYGNGMAGSESLSLFEAGVQSRHPIVQMTAIQYLGQLMDDRSTSILVQALSSDFLAVRLEAAYHLATRKNPAATAHLEALMFKLPPPFREFFPEFYALIGTPKAISLLRQLMNDPELGVRERAILSAANFGRDDLLNYVRAAATHKNPAEQEVCAIALGMLGDTHQRERLEQLSNSTYDHVRLAALRALYQMGDMSCAEKIQEMAKQGDLFAILALGSIEGSTDVLKSLLTKSADERLNASLALLQHKDPACTLALAEFLTALPSELACKPVLSTGRAQTAWSFAPPSEKYAKLTRTDVMALTLDLKQRILLATIDLPEESFLQIAHILLSTRVTPLIPTLVRLLENNKSEKAIDLLKAYSNALGAPLIRGFCNLALYRLDVPGPYEELITNEIARLKETELIRFRATPPKNSTGTFEPFTLTPEETSYLLIESYQALCAKQDAKSIDILLKSIAEGHPKNRSVLAGLLLKALQ